MSGAANGSFAGAGTAKPGSFEEGCSDKTGSQSREATDEESSSLDTRIDTSPPKDDAKNHPGSKAAVGDLDVPENIETSGVQEFHPWNPMKALKDIEVGDYYFRQDYKAALDRYKEALYYKADDAVASSASPCARKKSEIKPKPGNTTNST